MTVEKLNTKKSLPKRIFKYIAILILFFIVFISSLILLIPRVEFLQNQLATRLQSFLEDDFIADLKIGKINFKSYDDIEISEVLLYTRGDTLAYIPKLELEFNFKQLLSNNIYVKKLKIYNSTFKILRSEDSTWNYNYIVFSTPDNDNTKSKTPVLNLKNIQLIKSNFSFIDSTSYNVIKSEKIDYGNMIFKNINTKIDAVIDIDKMKHEYNIKNLDFTEINSNTKVKNFNTPKVRFNENNSSIEDLSFNINSSDMNLEMEANGFSPINYNYDDLLRMQSIISIKSHNFNSDIANKFTDSLFKRNQILDISLDVNGNLSKLLINNFKVKGEGININASSYISNIDEPDAFKYDLTLNKTTINTTYLKEVFYYDLESIPDLKLTYFNKFHSKGNLNNFSVEYDIISNLGKINGESSLSLNEQEYSTNTTFKDFNLLTILPDLYSTSLNGNIKINAKSFDLSNLSGNLKLNITDGYIENIPIDTIFVISDIKNGIVDINNLEYKSFESTANLNGKFDLNNLENINYDFNLITNKLDLSFLSNDFPKVATTNFKVKGSGFDLDKMNLSAKVNINDLFIDQYEIKNYNFELALTNQNKKELELKSDEIYLNASGIFNFTDLIDVCINEYNYIYHDIELVSTNFNKDTISEIKFLEKYPDMNIDIDLDINSINKFKDFIPFKFNILSDIKIHIDSKENNLNIYSSTLKVNDFHIIDESTNINSKKIDFIFEYHKDLFLENPIKSMETKVTSDNIRINDFNINNLDLFFDIKNDEIHVNTSFAILDSLEFTNNLTIKSPFIDTYQVDISKLQFKLGSYNNYFNEDFIQINIKNDNLISNNFKINSENNESIKLKFNIELLSKLINELEINFNNFNLNNLNNFIESEYLTSLYGDISNMNLSMKGKFNNPKIKLSLEGDNLLYSDIKLGNINSIFENNLNNFTGKLKLGKDKNILQIDFNQFPLLIDFENNLFAFDEKKQFDINLIFEKLNAGLAEPFVPVIYDLKGEVNSLIKINGTIEKGINYKGDLTLTNGSFIVEPTNMNYNFDAKVSIENDKFTLYNTSVRNRDQDFKNGKANIEGFLKMDGFDFDYFEFYLTSNKIKVMREETKYVSPDIFGDMVISSGNNPLIFSGNFDYPDLKGDLNILTSKLTMPSEISSQYIESKLHYEYVNNKIIVSLDDSLETEEKEISQDFLDILNMDLNIKFIDDLEMFIELNSITEMKIFLGTKFKDDIIVFDKKRNKENSQLIGNIYIKDNSYLTFLGKKFNTSGELSFPTGEISNPNLNILSKYSNFTSNGIPFEVLIDVKGTKDKPELDFSYIYNNIPATEDKKEMEQNAFSLLALNLLKDDALGPQSQNSNLQGEAVNIGNSILSNLATKNINEALLDYGVNANIDLDINNPDQSVVKIQGKLLNNIKWSVGGNISNIESNQISIEIPLGHFSYLQLSRPNNPFIVKENQVEGEVKFRFGKSW